MSDFMNNTNFSHPLEGLEDLIDIDPVTGIPLITAFAPRTQSEVEAREWFWNELRRRELEAIGRHVCMDGTEIETHVSIDGSDTEPSDG